MTGLSATEHAVMGLKSDGGELCCRGRHLMRCCWGIGRVLAAVRDVRLLSAQEVHDGALASTRELYAAVVDSLVDLPAGVSEKATGLGGINS